MKKIPFVAFGLTICATVALAQDLGHLYDDMRMGDVLKDNSNVYWSRQVDRLLYYAGTFWSDSTLHGEIVLSTDEKIVKYRSICVEMLDEIFSDVFQEGSLSYRRHMIRTFNRNYVRMIKRLGVYKTYKWNRPKIPK